jgi:hypothetical protein
MAVKYLPGRTFFLLLSDDAWVTTYTLVCLMKQALDRERSVTKVETQCELAKSFGAIDRSMNLECVTNLTPDAVVAGVGQASHKKISAWFEASVETLHVKRRMPDPAGTDQYAESACTITKLSDAVDVQGNQSFTMTLELTGAFDETP